jgi:uncharacterized membrane protein YkvA (DUF1232 family)
MVEEAAGDTGREVVPGVLVTRDGRIGPGGRTRGDRTWVELARFLADVGRLLWDLSRDARVPWTAKVVAFGAMAYVVSPIDLIPDVIPGAGRIDDLYLVVRALRFLTSAAGYDVVREHWRGTDDGFALLLMLAGVEH